MEERIIYLAEDEYLVTAFVPSDTACLANSPGKMSLTLRESQNRSTGSVKADLRSLDFSRRDGRLLVVSRELGRLSGNAFEDIWSYQRGSSRWTRQPHTIDKRVQDGHGTSRDTSVGVDLFEDCKGKSASVPRHKAPKHSPL